MTENYLKQERMRIGHQLADIRMQKGLTQQFIANWTGIGRPHISRIESGKSNVGVDQILKYAHYLRCPLIFSNKGLLEIEDIRLGNWVTFQEGGKAEPEDEAFKIFNIEPNKSAGGRVWYLIQLEANAMSNGLIKRADREIEDVRPVWLTMGWLKQFAFQQTGHTWHITEGGKRFLLANEVTETEPGEDLEMSLFLYDSFNTKTRTRVDFVHQLQNLFEDRMKKPLVLAGSPKTIL